MAIWVVSGFAMGPLTLFHQERPVNAGAEHLDVRRTYPQGLNLLTPVVDYVDHFSHGRFRKFIG
jgi:hypothetical protein